MSEWRLEKLDDDDESSWNILKLDEDGDIASTVLQGWDETEARHALAALRWYDSFQCDMVSIPKPKPMPAKVKIAVREIES